MAEPKTKPTKVSVTKYIAGVTPERRRLDALAVMKLMKRVTGKSPVMWGPSIVGYDMYLLKYASGREVEWPVVGFSPRKSALVLYIMRGFPRFDSLVAKLGKLKTSTGCLYVTNLEDVDTAVLEELIRASVDNMRRKHTPKA